MEEKNKTQNDNNISPLAAGITGLVLGAASAAAIALSDEATRKKATKKALQVKDDLKKWSNKNLSGLESQTKTLKSKTEKKVIEVKDDVATQMSDKIDDARN